MHILILFYSNRQKYDPQMLTLAMVIFISVVPPFCASDMMELICIILCWVIIRGCLTVAGGHALYVARS
jgi:hypothetical protein